MNKDKKIYFLMSTKDRDYTFRQGSLGDVIHFADMIVSTVSKTSLFTELNDFQLHLSSDTKLKEEDWEKTCFVNKSTIPPYYVNLFLAKYNLEIV